MMSKSIHTERLTLRPYRDEDATVVAELIGNLSVSRWLTRVPHPYTLQDALSYFELSSGAENVLAITLEDDVIGGCAIETELGYWLGEPYWGKGYASEAAAALVDRHFRTNTTTLRSGYMPGNNASARVLSKLGFEPADVQDAECRALHTTVSLQKMRLSVESWRARS
ncbi:GNAT family N-acetyltransferase [uncultured Roseobacter sp.]|uniref:GNAT family N-acetyltransferase n=2 Tax=uncultured Roseobacter sp. TaxID=114847 RepID=UPI002601C1C7|nr:GNAT family N-acetyltransferase [uncultured Roseobacter sp.]